MAYSVSQRTQEIGLRMALGATPREISGMVLRRGLGLAAAGVAAGGILTLLASGLAAGLLHGVSPRDPLALGLAGAALAGVTLLASYVPARRAARMDPAVTLRG